MTRDLHAVDRVHDLRRGPVDPEVMGRSDQRRAEHGVDVVRAVAAARLERGAVRAGAEDRPRRRGEIGAETDVLEGPGGEGRDELERTPGRKRSRSCLRRAPSSVSWPPPTAAVPLGSHCALLQSAGSELPENSAPTAGVSSTSPSPGACVTTEHAVGIPAEKFAAVVSVAANVGTVNVAGAAGEAGAVAGLAARSAEVTR